MESRNNTMLFAILVTLLILFVPFFFTEDVVVAFPYTFILANVLAYLIGIQIYNILKSGDLPENFKIITIILIYILETGYILKMLGFAAYNTAALIYLVPITLYFLTEAKTR